MFGLKGSRRSKLAAIGLAASIAAGGLFVASGGSAHAASYTSTSARACANKGVTVAVGSSGTCVAVLQYMLREFGYKDESGNKIAVDGSFGSKTWQALARYDKNHGWSVNGKAGAPTFKKMAQEWDSKYSYDKQK